MELQAQQDAAPTLEQFLPLAKSLARKVAAQPADEDDLIQEGCLALHAALGKVPEPRNPWAFAKTILLRTMRGYYLSAKAPLPYQGQGCFEFRADLPRVHRFVFPEDLPPKQRLEHSSTPQDDVAAEIELRHYLDALQDFYGLQARWAAETLLSPGPLFGRFLLAEMKEKQAHNERGEGPRQRGIETTRISHRQIREALGLGRGSWTRLLTEIRAFTQEWLENDGNRSQTDKQPTDD